MAVSLLYQEGNRAVALELDAELRESFKSGVQLTRHPVEEGQPVTDHLQGEPCTYEVEGILSASTGTGDAATQEARVAAALDVLEELRLSGDLLTVATQHRTMRNMHLRTCVADRDSGRAGRVRVHLSFEEVLVARTEQIRIVEARRRVPARTKGKLDEGRQVTAKAPVEVVRKSVLAAGVDGDYFRREAE